MGISQTDRIEKQAILRAPLERVWRAISDSSEFGSWFKARCRQPFVAGTTVTAELTEPGHVGRLFRIRVEVVDPPRLFAFRWRPHEFESDGDDFADSTLVEFFLAPHAEGTLLRIVESGFDRLPESEREAQLRGNDEGWTEQMQRVGAYVSGTDRIEKRISLKAPMERVWAAIAEAAQFCAWFGLDEPQGSFEPGKTVTLRRRPDSNYPGLPMTLEIVSKEAGRLFAFRWHPYAVDQAVDYSREPTTLVEFFLETEGDGTLLTVTESGFNALPESRRATAFQMNSAGWAAQAERVREYVDG